MSFGGQLGFSQPNCSSHPGMTIQIRLHTLSSVLTIGYSIVCILLNVSTRGYSKGFGASSHNLSSRGLENVYPPAVLCS
ncbi:hypothetical protein BDQ12DRAFT_688512 [Crucibulum laeve]|uniref:Uncharacterized protein n=1 Tax=Crucibulum laeve TaxID=68775 RepID=A0A5C3LR20_9AGAR|nr:hypothetical protein BDQ12DRAFT_688512 [Crucibulum laeve]